MSGTVGKRAEHGARAQERAGGQQSDRKHCRPQNFGRCQARERRYSSTTIVGVAFAVNDALSISYGEQETEIDGQSLDQELEGFSIGYSMGGMTFQAHSNEGTNLGGTASNASEHTELTVSFAF